MDCLRGPNPSPTHSRRLLLAGLDMSQSRFNVAFEKLNKPLRVLVDLLAGRAADAQLLIARLTERGYGHPALLGISTANERVWRSIS